MAQQVRNLPAMQKTLERQIQSLGQEDPFKKKWQPTLVFLPEKPHGQRSLVGYCPKGLKELDTTEHAVTDSYLFLPCSFKGEIVYLLYLSLEGFSQPLKISSCDWIGSLFSLMVLRRRRICFVFFFFLLL